MSEVVVIIVKDCEISSEKMHYRDAMSLLESNLRKIKQKDSQKLDAGYLIIDVDRQIMLDCQSGFSLEHLKPDARLNIIKNWYYLNHPSW
jgi:hypothetical protein